MENLVVFFNTFMRNWRSGILYLYKKEERAKMYRLPLCQRVCRKMQMQCTPKQII